jgi:hypothetical protein
MRKNVVIRNIWMTYEVVARVRLGDESATGQLARSTPGKNDMLEWRKTPLSRAIALTASSAWIRSRAATEL